MTGITNTTHRTAATVGFSSGGVSAALAAGGAPRAGIPRRSVADDAGWPHDHRPSTGAGATGSGHRSANRADLFPRPALLADLTLLELDGRRRPRMQTHATVGSSGRLVVGGRYRAAVGATVILTLAIGLAIGWGATVEHLTTVSNTAATSNAVARLSAAEAIDLPYDQPQRRRGTLFTHVVDRWYDEPPAAMIKGAGGGGFGVPDLPNGAAPNEL